MSMRTIKFRAWNKTHRYWTKPEEMMMGWGTFRLGNIDDGIEMDDDFVIEQFTGLLDKTGKEIYEGDILGHWAEKTWYVVWNTDGRWSFSDLHLEGKPQFSCSRSEVKNKKVIGNIHENPNLLK